MKRVLKLNLSYRVGFVYFCGNKVSIILTLNVFNIFSMLFVPCLHGMNLEILNCETCKTLNLNCEPVKALFIFFLLV